MMHEGDHPESDPLRDDQALWSLLEGAPRPKAASPYFARRVLREVAALEAKRAARSRPLAWLVRAARFGRRQSTLAFVGALGAVALFAGGIGVISWRPPAAAAIQTIQTIQAVQAGPASVAGTSDVPVAQVPGADVGPGTANATTSAGEAITAQDVEVIADLDNVLSREESRLWTEDSARF